MEYICWFISSMIKSCIRSIKRHFLGELVHLLGANFHLSHSQACANASQPWALDSCCSQLTRSSALCCSPAPPRAVNVVLMCGSERVCWRSVFPTSY